MKKKVQPSTFPKRLFLFPLMKASRAETDGQMLFEWNFLRLSPFIHTCKGRIKFLFCGAKKGEGGGLFGLTLVHRKDHQIKSILDPHPPPA